MNERIELHPAHVWDCPECGKENFERAVVVEFSEEDANEMRKLHGVDCWETGDWTSAPTEVECKHCGKEFETVDYREERDDDAT